MKLKLIFKDRCPNDELPKNLNREKLNVSSESKIKMGI